MKCGQMEYESAIVPALAKQAEEVRDRWSWAEPCVWTERMLTTLEKGVRRGFSVCFKAGAGRLVLLWAWAVLSPPKKHKRHFALLS